MLWQVHRNTLLSPWQRKSTYVKAAHTADIVDTAVTAGSFNPLVAAVKVAELVETLKSADLFPTQGLLWLF
jgi:uncharacterized surface protein with fasciclin (FAS1) repeats